MRLKFKTNLVAKKFCWFNQIDSTNKFIKRNVKCLPDGFCAISNNQTNGYGSKNRNWICHKNSSLAFSILLKDVDWNFLKMSTMIAAVSLVESLESLNVKDVQIKWFNDILIKNKKVAGILGESQIEQYKTNLILGIGINLLQKNVVFKQTNLPFAGSIFSQTNKKIKSQVLLKQFIKQFETHLLEFNSDHIFKKYCKFSKIVNKLVSVINNKTNQISHGYVKSILDDGRLLIKLNNNLYFKANPSAFSLYIKG